MIILSIDYGDVRTGIAVSDERETLASPVKTIINEDMSELSEQIIALAKETGAGHMVMGHPINMDGTTGERAVRCEVLVEKIREQCDIPVTLWDERLTTVEARRVLNMTNVRGKKRKATIDMVAAVMILDNFLTYRENQRKKQKQ